MWSHHVFELLIFCLALVGVLSLSISSLLINLGMPPGGRARQGLLSPLPLAHTLDLQATGQIASGQGLCLRIKFA